MCVYIYVYIYIYKIAVVRLSWARIPLGPTFYVESKNLSSK